MTYQNSKITVIFAELYGFLKGLIYEDLRDKIGGISCWLIVASYWNRPPHTRGQAPAENI